MTGARNAGGLANHENAANWAELLQATEQEKTNARGRALGIFQPGAAAAPSVRKMPKRSPSGDAPNAAQALEGRDRPESLAHARGSRKPCGALRTSRRAASAPDKKEIDPRFKQFRKGATQRMLAKKTLRARALGKGQPETVRDRYHEFPASQVAFHGVHSGFPQAVAPRLFRRAYAGRR